MHMAPCRCIHDSSSAHNRCDCRAHAAPSLMASPCQTTWCGHHLIKSTTLLRWWLLLTIESCRTGTLSLYSWSTARSQTATWMSALIQARGMLGGIQV